MGMPKTTPMTRPMVASSSVAGKKARRSVRTGREVENEVPYVYRRNYVTALPDLAPTTGSRLPIDPFKGDWLSGLQKLRDEASITALGGDPRGRRRAERQEYTLVRDHYTTDQVA